MKSFKEFRDLNESEKFGSMYELEAFIQGKRSPTKYKDILDFLNRLPVLPSIMKNVKFYQGRFDTLVFDSSNNKYKVELDYNRKLLKLHTVIDEVSKDVFYKSFAFQELI